MPVASITDALLASLCAAAYATPPRWRTGDVRAVRYDVGDITIIALPGTRPSVLADWVRDADALPLYHPATGVCHRGFLSGALDIFPLIWRDLSKRKVVITGHSLGGAEAIALGALFTAAGNKPLAIVTFGAPRVGLEMLRTALRGVTVRQYRDGNDVVPNLTWPYEHVVELTQIGAPAVDPISDHLIGIYATVVEARPPVMVA